MEHDVTTTHGWTAALDEVVMTVIETRRQIAALDAAQARALSAAADLVSARVGQGLAAGRRMTRSDLALREVVAELGAALRVTDRTIQSRMGDATTLTARFAQTLAAWEAGRIDAGHVNAILDAGVMIDDDDLRAQYESVIVPIAETESAGRLRGIAAAVAARIDPDSARARSVRAIDERRVRKFDLGDGAGRLIMDHSLVLVEAAFDRLTQMARTVQHGDATAGDDGVTDGHGVIATDGHDDRTGDQYPDTGEAALVTGPSARGPEPVADASSASHDVVDESVDADPPEVGDRRTLDQIRADVCADLLLAGAPAAHGEGDALQAVTGHVQITVPALTATGSGTEPCLLAGQGPIPRDIALRLAGNATGWDRVITDPLTGAVLATDRYRPSRGLRRHLAARDERCRFPGCQRPAIRADIDHTHDAAKGGATCESNLGHFCRRHHTLKHHTTWAVRQLSGGVIEWTSPTRRTYVDRPPATVRFVPTGWLERARAAATPGDPAAPF